jgi:Na+/H+ antiporter NhaC
MNKVSYFIGSLLLGLAVFYFFIGWYPLVPAFVVLGLALLTRKALEPLFFGCVVGFFMMPKYGDPQLIKNTFGYGVEKGIQFPLNMLAGMEDTIGRGVHNYGFIWLILIVMLYGGLVQLMVSSGGVDQLVKASGRYIKSQKHSLVMTFVLGLVFFIDDYMNALAVGNTMRPITDKFKVSREKLAMMVSFVSTPITILVPISTWTIFYGSQLLAIDTVAVSYSNPVSAFANTIPYNISAWVSLLVAVLVIWKIIPDTKGIKSTEEKEPHSNQETELQINLPNANEKQGKLWYYIVPLVILIFFSLLPYPTSWNAETFTLKGFTENIDALRGVATAFFATYILYLFSGAISFKHLTNSFIKGMEGMTFVLILLAFTFMLREVQGVLGFDHFVADKLGNLVNPKLLPAIIFLAVSVISWATASSWGVYAIMVPLVSLLAQQSGANFWLAQGALASATVWGNAVCFYSDSRVLIAQATKADLIAYSIAQLPYQVLILVTSVLLYLLAGFIL